jgi:AmiR/NasT family two-component response regulator
MKSALILSSHGPEAPALADDLSAVGVRAVEMPDRTNLLQAVIKTAPDLIICFEQAPSPAFFEAFETVRATAPRPVAVFTTDPDADNIAMATRSGIHAYVVAGYSRNRLRSVMHLAQARFRQDELQRQELADLQRRFEERKLVDRAKGILMGARHLREEEAFRALRNAAMQSKQRIGQVSQLVIDSARYAEAVNRAGQLRMLSQRLVKLYALTCAGVALAETKGLFADSVAQIESTLAILGRSLSQPTFGDLLGAVGQPWARLRPVLAVAPRLDRLREVDALAEELLDHAERLTANLEVAAFATALHAINVAGRQRMLSQRLAKQALLLTLLPNGKTMDATTMAELEAGLAYLASLPLSNAAIVQELTAATQTWQSFQVALAARDTQPGRELIAGSSEELLGQFDRLTDQLERGIQAFIG